MATSTDLFPDHISTDQFTGYIRNFNFEDLFIELGWDRFTKNIPLQAGDQQYELEGIAEKRGFAIFQCLPKDGSRFPKASERDKLDRRLTKLHNEHLIIYGDLGENRQLWEYRLKEPNQPDRRRKVEYYTHQDPGVLFHKLEGLFFSINEEDQISIIDVKKRVAEQFDQNYEKVTKKFYKKFKKEHKAFRKFIEGIDESVDKDWYASLMLNRLMFVYFIQKKGFLDEDRDYLCNKLNQVQEEEGEDEFYNFYTDFLTVLFHKGLGHPDRTSVLEQKLGKVPYLNGGLFDVHKLETKHPELKIKDDAFERLFDFFDEYNWYLDNRKQAAGKDINPDVIGYIFEKYINDRADMGAYYTQEDITDYISKNCIIPWLFDEMKRRYAKPFSRNGEIWIKLKRSGDTYIYDAVKRGIQEAADGQEDVQDIDELTIPENIAKGLDTEAPNLLERREDWNTKTPQKFALPTEIWRETVERWQRYFDIKAKIEGGELTSVNDLITYNLNIKQFAQDVMEETDDPELVKACWKALTKVTVLDPTCGSGAFLFAALNVLEPLYETCMQKMEAFVDEEGEQKYRYFSDELNKIHGPEHPNHEYFIYKSIILHNLYGVDIMHEAVEIAKLRLFLKLMGTVEVDYDKPNLGLEPLPDIDFNIRAGNTLVGYATQHEFEELAHDKLDFENDKQPVLDQADLVNRTYRRFKEKQLTEEYGSRSYKKAKEEVNHRLATLNEKLNRYLALSYLPNNYKEEDYEQWLESHQPFHWLAEFYDIIEEQGGFDVIIGNPPYVEYSKVKDKYRLIGFKTFKCGNLYAFVTEICYKLIGERGSYGMIIPLSSISTKRMNPLQKLMLHNSDRIHISNYESTTHPTVLFVGAQIQLSIMIAKKGKFNTNKNPSSFITGYRRSYAEARRYLFDNVKYAGLKNSSTPVTNLPKIADPIENKILLKFFNQDKKLGNYFVSKETSSKSFWYRNFGNFYFKLAFIGEPKFIVDGKQKKSSTISQVFVSEETNPEIFVSIIGSTLFYWYWVLFSDLYHLTKTDIKRFPLNINALNSLLKQKLIGLGKDLIESNYENAKWCTYNKKSGVTCFWQFWSQPSKPIIDEIDKILADHYGFSNKELNFLQNYDIKYRMGDELGKD
jgi:hypothetical protein